MRSIIQEVERIVEAACAAETNTFGYGIWTHHIRPVAQTARNLAADFQADPEIVEIAALLHDYAAIKDEKLAAEHHIHGPVEAKQILKKLKYDTKKIEAVKHCIATHRASVASERKTAEAECLANADAIVHIQNVPSLLQLVLVQWNMDLDAGVMWVKSKLQRTWRKLSPQIRDVMWDKYIAALDTLTTLRPASVAPSEPTVRNRVIYSINTSDVQTVADRELQRSLDRGELRVVEDRLSHFIDWYEAVQLAITGFGGRQPPANAI